MLKLLIVTLILLIQASFSWAETENNLETKPQAEIDTQEAFDQASQAIKERQALLKEFKDIEVSREEQSIIIESERPLESVKAWHKNKWIDFERVSENEFISKKSLPFDKKDSTHIAYYPKNAPVYVVFIDYEITSTQDEFNAKFLHSSAMTLKEIEDQKEAQKRLEELRKKRLKKLDESDALLATQDPNRLKVMAQKKANKLARNNRGISIAPQSFKTPRTKETETMGPMLYEWISYSFLKPIRTGRSPLAFAEAESVSGAQYRVEIYDTPTSHFGKGRAYPSSSPLRGFRNRLNRNR